jgi:hypothetical protein
MNVFISHAAKDEDYARSLRKALTTGGVSVWEPQSIEPGGNWALEAGKALDNADAVVVLLSPDAIASEWVRRDIEFAISSARLKDRLIPIVVRPTSNAPWILQELPQWLGTVNPSTAAKNILDILKVRKAPVRARAGEAR